jgi:soluble lytic murein transglycosylase-like protein
MIAPIVAGILLAGPAASANSGSAPAPSIEQTGESRPIIVAILSDEDAALYREIFDLQDAGHWKRADKLIVALENDILLGHVLFQRYMHPTAYRSSFAELSKWLEQNADLPGAVRIYRLARRRQGQARPPKVPPKAFVGDNHTDGTDLSIIDPSPSRSTTDAAEVRRITNYVWRQSVRRSEPERGERHLWAFERRGILQPVEIDKMLGQISGAYFFDGKDEKALALASYAAKRSRNEMSQPDWIAGLAAWRLGDCLRAAEHFDAVATSRVAGKWQNAAGAYWASRAYLSCRQPDLVNQRLRAAANFDETFYGQISARQLGIRAIFDWNPPELNAEKLESLSGYAGVRRGIALDQVGITELADEELRLVFNRQGTKVRRDLVALAAHLGTPATQVLLASRTPESERLPISVRYPLPDWEPDGGFKIDRAVIYGMMRQESGFRPRARSPVGAMGLMQLMPDTASYITKDRSLRRSRKDRLYDPVLNITISQNYAQMLLESEPTDGNLFKLAVAYNGGPGNLARWQKQMDFKGDPLLFIETIPSAETRNFIERVFSNIWIYRARLGQPSPSLDAVASGAWPDYVALDNVTLKKIGRTTKEALNAQD